MIGFGRGALPAFVEKGFGTVKHTIVGKETAKPKGLVRVKVGVATYMSCTQQQLFVDVVVDLYACMLAMFVVHFYITSVHTNLHVRDVFYIYIISCLFMRLSVRFSLQQDRTSQRTTARGHGPSFVRPFVPYTPRAISLTAWRNSTKPWRTCAHTKWPPRFTKTSSRSVRDTLSL